MSDRLKLSWAYVQDDVMRFSERNLDKRARRAIDRM